MQIPIVDQEVLKNAYGCLYEAVGNVTCLYHFISKKYPNHSDIEYTLYIHSIYRADTMGKTQGVEIKYPVFGKEIDMGNRERIYTLIKNNLGVDKILYIDFENECEGECINEELSLCEITI